MLIKRGVQIMHEQIQQRMAELGISQSELARRAGVSAAYISQVVNGQRGKRMSVETEGHT
jgi:predicted transcriptional regulator